MIDVTLTIDRTSLSLTDLTVGGASTTYILDGDGFSLPGTTWARSEVGGEYVHGELLTSARKQNTTWAFTVQVRAADASACRTAARALVRALEQFPSYDLTATIDGESDTWRCYPADSRPGGPLLFDFETADYVWPVAFTVPAYPIPGS